MSTHDAQEAAERSKYIRLFGRIIDFVDFLFARFLFMWMIRQHDRTLSIQISESNVERRTDGRCRIAAGARRSSGVSSGVNSQQQ